MRIGIFDPYLDDLGGGEKYMMTIAQCLSQTNKVDVFWDNKEDIKALLTRFSLDLSKVNLVKNIFSPKISTLWRFFQSKKYDAIIFLSDGSIPLVFPKLYVHIQEPLNRMQNASVLDKFKLKRVSAFFCNSLYTKHFIDKRFFLKTKVIYPPVFLYPKNIRKENIILHVGRFRVKNFKNDDFKKQGVMIYVFKKMVDKGLKNWKFVLAVSVSEKDILKFEVLKKKCAGYPIEFLVNKSNIKIWDIYSKAKIYWHASGFGEDLEKNPEFAEHFGISTVEAMGAGVVPVVINAGGQREIVEEGKNGFLWNSLDELESKTLLLINDEEKLNQLSKEAKKSAEKFSAKNFCKIINELIQ